MQLENINEVVRAGLTYERTRAEIASYNLAVANVPIRPGSASPIKSPTPSTVFLQQLGQVSPDQRKETRMVHEPTHPFADSHGMVHYPKLDAAKEMTTLVSATRAYEADIRAYNSLRAMTLKAFEIGK